jgi:hypothetical protein
MTTRPKEETMQLATSRYHAGDLVKQATAEQGLIPIGITVGPARYLPYELAANLMPLAPFGLMKLPPDKFEPAYLGRLDTFGVEAIERMIASVVDAYMASGAVLLCFEKVLEGEVCHRRMFASWWERQTGDDVPELTPAQITLPTR